MLTRGLKRGGAPVRIKCEVEISAVLNYVIVQQLAFFTFVCITQLFLALRYSLYLIIFKFIAYNYYSLNVFLIYNYNYFNLLLITIIL